MIFLLILEKRIREIRMMVAERIFSVALVQSISPFYLRSLLVGESN